MPSCEGPLKPSTIPAEETWLRFAFFVFPGEFLEKTGARYWRLPRLVSSEAPFFYNSGDGGYKADLRILSIFGSAFDVLGRSRAMMAIVAGLEAATVGFHL